MTRPIALLRALCVALPLTLPLLAGAAPAAPAYPLDEATLAAFGQREGLGRLTQDFVARMTADPRLAVFFKGVNQAQLSAKLADQFCVVLGGPCQYKGADMKTAHEGMDIRKGEFNALVEVLQQAMDAQGVPFAAQNRLLARLAPMHRDVISAP